MVFREDPSSFLGPSRSFCSHTYWLPSPMSPTARTSSFSLQSLRASSTYFEDFYKTRRALDHRLRWCQPANFL